MIPHIPPVFAFTFSLSYTYLPISCSFLARLLQTARPHFCSCFQEFPAGLPPHSCQLYIPRVSIPSLSFFFLSDARPPTTVSSTPIEALARDTRLTTRPPKETYLSCKSITLITVLPSLDSPRCLHISEAASLCLRYTSPLSAARSSICRPSGLSAACLSRLSTPFSLLQLPLCLSTYAVVSLQPPRCVSAVPVVFL